jgi:hypothetical protein
MTLQSDIATLSRQHKRRSHLQREHVMQTVERIREQDSREHLIGMSIHAIETSIDDLCRIAGADADGCLLVVREEAEIASAVERMRRLACLLGLANRLCGVTFLQAAE